VHLTKDHIHFGWDNSVAPVSVVEPGATVTLDLVEASGGQLSGDSVASDLAALDFDRLNPVTGPLYIDGAVPGDVIAISIDELDVASWGWSANIPGFGLLSDQFPEAHLARSVLEGGVARLSFGAVVPLVPMVGTIGVALPEPGIHSVVPPRRFGGNLDIRHITRGATLMLPVGVDGALLSVGDAHGAMGDGEVCGTGIETDAVISLRVEVLKGKSIAYPRYITSEKSTRSGGALATTGVGPDLMVATRDAVSAMIDEIVTRTGIASVDAYILTSVAADLKISEVVDAPNWVVSMHLPLTILEDSRGS
jgi:acetamidase/formamidase